jgi:hypothetical protein
MKKGNDENKNKILDKKIIIINEENKNIIDKKNKENLIIDNKIDKIREKLEKEVNTLINNKVDLINNIKKKKENNIFNSNWNVSSNFKLNTFANDNILYKSKFIKNPSIKDKLISEGFKPKGIILPDIKPQNIKKDHININVSNNLFSHFTKIPKEALINNMNNEAINEISCEKSNNIFRNLKLNKIINNNVNVNDTRTTQSATDSIKNNTSSKNNIVPNIKDDNNNKYEMGLISTGATTNNSIIIPLLSTKHPSSELNSGEKVIFTNNEINENKGNDTKKEGMNKFELTKCHISSPKTRNKNINIKEIYKNNNISLKYKEKNNLLSGVQKLIPNFHKIKIEKGMNNNNNNSNILLNSFSRKISYDYKSKNNINFNDVKFKSIDQ